MAELLIKAKDATHQDAEKDRRGCYKRGMPVLVMPDGHSWGAKECLPSFVIIKIPGISVGTVKKYIEPELSDTANENGEYPIYRRRLWKIRFDDLPAAAKNKIIATGGLTIKAGAYAGEYDYTWKQVKGYFRNLKTNIDESENL